LNSRTKNILIAVAAAAVLIAAGIYWLARRSGQSVSAYVKGKLPKSKAPSADSSSTASGGGSASTGGFPVTTNSDKATILAAFNASGYFNELRIAGLSEDVIDATADPAGWLNDHPYLYAAKPSYFRK
jgi:hypothetical protein